MSLPSTSSHAASAVRDDNGKHAGNDKVEPNDETLDVELGKWEDETMSTVTYDSDDDGDELDPEKFRPEQLPKRSRLLTPFNFAWLTLGSMGIVYGDIGTSPLYTWSSIMTSLQTYEEEDLLGAMCLMIYSLLGIVTIKYATFVMMADNKGEGGIFALTSLVPPTRNQLKKLMRRHEHPPLWKVWVKRTCMALCIIGAGFILGDGALTPAVSVLSAIEGLGVVNDRVVDYEVILGITILGLLFISQSFGTAKISGIFGPITLVYFGLIGGVGIYNIAHFSDGSVFRAFNPEWGYQFFARNGQRGYETLGAICLCFTGVEALYADMGHFGPWPIRTGWLFVVLPSVLLNYFGQLSYILTHSSWTGPIFFACVPTPLYWPVLVFATLATVIASQAMISATSSLISQAMGLDACPPLELRHTNEAVHGQVYAPAGNWVLMVATLGLVLFFQSSSSLSAAYGIAVTGTMAATTLIFTTMVILRWRWSAFVMVPVGAFFFFVEMVYFSSNMVKFPDGGWVAMLLAAVVILFMASWRLGKSDVQRTLAAKASPKSLRDVVRWASDGNVPRVPGTGVFLGGEEEAVPKALLQHFKLHGSLPSSVVVVMTKTIDLPRIKPEAHLSCRSIGPGLVKLTVRRGFVEPRSDTGEVLQQAENLGVFKPDPKSTRFFYLIARQTVALRQTHRFWTYCRLGLYNFMVMNARPPACVSMVVPKHHCVEYHSVLQISKPFPGSNFISRFVNGGDADHTPQS